MNSFILSVLIIFSQILPAFSSEETFYYRGSRNDVVVNLEEDFYQNRTVYEDVPVTRVVCNSRVVYRPVCQTYPARRECRPVTVCQQYPMGPVCQTVPQCVIVPGGSYCEQRGFPENYCQNVTTIERRQTQRREFIHRTYAEMEYDFTSVAERGESVDFMMNVGLENDQLTHRAEDSDRRYVILADLEENSYRSNGDWRIDQKLSISAVDQEDFFSLTSQIPVLASTNNGIISFQVAPKHDQVAASLRLFIRTNRGQTFGRELSPSEFYFVNQPTQGRNSLVINLRSILGPYWRYWVNQQVFGSIELSISGTKQILNSNQYNNWRVSTQFSTRL